MEGRDVADQRGETTDRSKLTIKPEHIARQLILMELKFALRELDLSSIKRDAKLSARTVTNVDVGKR